MKPYGIIGMKVCWLNIVLFSVLYYFLMIYVNNGIDLVQLFHDLYQLSADYGMVDDDERLHWVMVHWSQFL